MENGPKGEDEEAAAAASSKDGGKRDVVMLNSLKQPNADVSIRDEKVMGSPHGNYGTNLILLSDDDTGFMPYRIDNFSRERLRIYQQRCETLETVVHSYTSCPYAWDEPCYAHRLTVEKPERTLLVSVHAEGALKVLSVIDSSSHILNDVKGSLLPRFKGKGKCDHNQAFHCKERISVSIPFIGISVMNSYPQELLFASVKNTTIDLVRSLDQQKFSFQVSSLQIDNQLHSTPYPVILYFDRDYKANPISQIRSKDDTTTVISADSSNEPVLSLAAAIWNSEDMSLISFEFIHLRVADLHLELEQEVILSFSDFLKTISSRLQSGVSPYRDPTLLSSDFNFVNMPPTCPQTHALMKANGDKFCSINGPIFTDNWKSSALLPSIVPIGAPWQQIHLLARKQKKIYVELFDLASFKLTLSTPWMLRNGAILSGESLIHRGLMALADVEGAQIQFKQLVIAHQLASWESINDILIRHYMRQLFHEMYKSSNFDAFLTTSIHFLEIPTQKQRVFGSAGVIGNPMGFARSVGLGIKDFVSVPARSVMETPAGLITGISQGTTSLLSNTVYAISDAATQFSRAARKGIVAFTFDDQAVEDMEKQQKGVSLSKGVINEFLEGLTGLLQSPIKGAEKHGLPGVFSGIALGVTGLVARPAASILEVTGKTAQSIRNRSKLHHQRLRARLPRPLSRVFPLRPYSWEEAVGTYVLAEADGGLKLKDEILVICKALGEGGKFVIVTERLVLIISCSSLVDLGKPRFQGIPADPEWVIEAEIGMDSVIHADADEEVVHIVGSSSDTLLRQNQHQQKRGGGMKGNRWHNSPTPLPLFQTNLEFTCKEAAENFLQILLSTIEKGQERGWGCVHLLHQSNLK
ncbi:hypothetical protein RJ639_034370 [Escallonia herrerae]|uniref:Intermembrane lipid transfer protein VPS13-like C-terminal domain-containing protein n=1 Tax=Escallonia herrerae TaxID=1293975 RepID=A0AA88WVR7_9ASTE|nr:hypothetical protein RJ639_034370 [Escallonia herrerae]